MLELLDAHTKLNDKKHVVVPKFNERWTQFAFRNVVKRLEIRALKQGTNK